MLPLICAGSPKAMQQIDIVQSRMSLRCSRGKCNYILAPSCAHSLLEKKFNIFQSLVYVYNQMYKCRLLITFDDKMFPRECLHVLTRISLRCSVSFSAPLCVLKNLLLVWSADNLFCKQLGSRSESAKLSCENGAHGKSRMHSLLERRFFFYFISYTMRHSEILYMQLNNAMFIYFKMCSICKFFTIIVENIYIRFQSLVT